VDATQKRRLVVFAVCALGVSALYLAPGTPRTPEQHARQPATAPRPSAAPVGQASPGPSSVARPVSARFSTPPQRVDPQAPAGSEAAYAPRTAPSVHQAGTDAPAERARGRHERTLPARVAEVEVDEVTADTVTVRWAAAADGAVGYRVSLNGFEVASTTEHQATIDFFRDDSTENVVQIRAVDRAGNVSAASTSVLVDRPAVTPTPTTDATAAGLGPTDDPTSPPPTATSSRTTADTTTSPTQTPGQGSGTDQQDPGPADPTSTESSSTARDPQGQNANRSSDPDVSGEHE
jgi:hypothetical protein